jgi:DeoR family fructose operon transcriptional repressor
MSNGFIPAARRQHIEHLVREDGVVKVADLSRELGVSELTIRRDLDSLERKGVLERTHGGAISSRRLSEEPPYTQKDQQFRAEKAAIGRAAAALVEDGDTVLINSGSTTLQVFPHLRDRHVRVITSNTAAIGPPGEMELILLGGLYRPQSNSIVGGLAALTLAQVYGSKAVIGVDGVSFKYGLTTPAEPEAQIARLMIERTRGPVIVVADHRKLGVVSNFLSASIEKVDVLVTDRDFDQGLREELEAAGLRIVVADGGAA